MEEPYQSEDDLFTLCDADGNEFHGEFLDLVDYDSREFVVLLPVDAERSNVVILEVAENPESPDTDNYYSVNDRDTLLAVYGIFKKKFMHIFDFNE